MDGFYLGEVKLWLAIYGFLWGFFPSKIPYDDTKIDLVKQRVYLMEVSVRKNNYPVTELPELIRYYLFWIALLMGKKGDEVATLEAKRVIRKIKDVDEKVYNGVRGIYHA